MKHLLLLIPAFCCALTSSAQLFVTDFETFTLSAQSYYQDTTNAPFHTTNAVFQHSNNKFGNLWYWTNGFAYTNVHDSSSGNFTNLYGVKAYKGYNGSDKFVVGQNQSVIQLASPQNTLEGFYVTNTTFAYKTMWLGDTVNFLSRKFGDTTGTGSGSTIAQGDYPDYFKLTVKGYRSGLLLNDSVEFYLADFRFANSALDYIVDSWQWVNTSSLGEVDSLKFHLSSSDVGQYGMNTPAFFAIDNLTTRGVLLGFDEALVNNEWKVFPVPFQNQLHLSTALVAGTIRLDLYDFQGKQIFTSELSSATETIELGHLEAGCYLLCINNGKHTQRLKIIKE